LYYAKKGIITPEMEYVAIRENQKIEQLETSPKEWLHSTVVTALVPIHPKERLPGICTQRNRCRKSNYTE
jgi:phosphomethylpyrimidine synthase